MQVLAKVSTATFLLQDWYRWIYNMINTEKIDFYSYPFGIPVQNPHSTKLAWILEKSLYIQAKHMVSNACLQVSIFLQRWIKAVGINSQMIYGIHQGAMNIPHVWLEVDGYIVDNTYLKDVELDDFILLKKGGEYKRWHEVEGEDLFLGDEYTRSLRIPDHNVSFFKWGISNVEKLLAMSYNSDPLSHYFRELESEIELEYEVSVPEIANRSCWYCGKRGDGLKKCAKCKVALYCDKDCQRNNWKTIHKQVYMCIPPWYGYIDAWHNKYSIKTTKAE